jgi:hypothetical protein
VRPGIEVGELVDPVQHVLHEFAQEDPWCDADPAARLSGDRLRQVADVGVVDGRADAIGCCAIPA